MTTPRSHDLSLRLAREARERFVITVRGLMAPLAAAILKRLDGDAAHITHARTMQEHRDDFLAFLTVETVWVVGVQKFGHEGRRLADSVANALPQAPVELQLMDDEMVENNILISRLGLRIQDAVGSEFNDLRLRVRELEDRTELANGDALRPEVLAKLLVNQWLEAGLGRRLWSRVQDTLCEQLLAGLLGTYKEANAFLVQHGVSPQIELRHRVRRNEVAVSGLMSAGVMDAGLRARNVLVNLKRFVSEHLGSGEVSGLLSGAVGSAPAFLAAISDTAYGYRQATEDDLEDATAEAVQRSAIELRRRTDELKRQAPTTADKATVEIVALMFQAILAEDRIPFSARVWFARLQMPVLRVAIAEPEFFGTLEHPARLLIDRMGSCVMGFNAAPITGSALESEIRRVVQVIEQYPETGQRVFELVYDEFVIFLSKYLTKSDTTQRVMTIAQQVEQKETMAIQYTIELRKMLDDMPVPEAIREFLFKVWAEVLAIAALRYGGQDERTVSLKRVASELVWAASAKSHRADRTRVIQDLPKLLQQLRQGMTLLGVVGEPQEAHLKGIGRTLADAFMSRTEAILSTRIEAMAQRLAHIEDFFGDAGTGMLPLDIASIELLLGVDAASLEVVPDTGSQVAPEMIDWARELQVGTWFQLDHNARVTPVQFVWRSERRQLHLFASVDGRSFLIQAGRLGSYLQAGLLVPAEEEALTVRATRDALAKLDANPEGLLN